MVFPLTKTQTVSDSEVVIFVELNFKLHLVSIKSPTALCWAGNITSLCRRHCRSAACSEKKFSFLKLNLSFFKKGQHLFLCRLSLSGVCVWVWACTSYIFTSINCPSVQPPSFSAEYFWLIPSPLSCLHLCHVLPSLAGHLLLQMGSEGEGLTGQLQFFTQKLNGGSFNRYISTCQFLSPPPERIPN